MANRPKDIFTRKSVPPCKDCPDRCIGCHSNCGKYIEWKAKEEKRKSVYDEMRKDSNVVNDYVRETVLRNKEMFAKRKGGARK